MSKKTILTALFSLLFLISSAQTTFTCKIVATSTISFSFYSISDYANGKTYPMQTILEVEFSNTVDNFTVYSQMVTENFSGGTNTFSSSLIQIDATQIEGVDGSCEYTHNQVPCSANDWTPFAKANVNSGKKFRIYITYTCKSTESVNLTSLLPDYYSNELHLGISFEE